MLQWLPSPKLFPSHDVEYSSVTIGAHSWAEMHFCVKKSSKGGATTLCAFEPPSTCEIKEKRSACSL